MIAELLSNVNFWIALGIFLLIVEIFIGAEFYALAIGLASLLTGFIVSSNNIFSYLMENFLFLNHWQLVLVIWSIVSVLIIVPLKFFIQKSDSDIDINQY